MVTRREFLEVAAATAMLTAGSGALGRLAAQQAITQDQLLAFEPKGQVTLLHLTDLHAQLKPLYFREPSINLGVGPVAGLPPHVTAGELLAHFGIEPGSLDAYLYSSEDFGALAKNYGKIGGLDRIATLVKAIRAERPDNTLLLDGGDTWQGSWTALQTRGEDVVRAMALLQPDAMTGHWEFTLGEERVQELVEQIGFPFLGANIRDTDWEEPVFEQVARFERGGVHVAVIGQAFPYTPIANPRWMIPAWSFGIREDELSVLVEETRADGAELVVLLSHNGFDVDRKLAGNVDGIDVILTAHTHDAIPEPTIVGKTLLITSGAYGKFLSRLDLDVGTDGIKDFSYSMIPVLSDAITPDQEMADLIAELRAPFEQDLAEVLGTADGDLYRRGNFNGTFDDVICDALLSSQDAEIALSPGFRWGASLPAGEDITAEFVYTHTAMTYPAVYRIDMTSEQLKLVFEDVADNLFNPDPYLQQGGDMVRVGGLRYRIDPNAKMGDRVTDMTLTASGEPIDAGKSYAVAGWASINEGTEGPPVYEVVKDYIKAKGTLTGEVSGSVDVVGL
ncbi:MAG: thiosulfohydrolase SoxB [Alphaproteobacteria bacterium]|nr:thiosulfohydrolase SoxB [Alphaproteobacteria bacterium]